MRHILLASMLVAAGAAAASAQTKSIQGEMKTATATVEAIDHAARQVTIKRDNGEYSTITVPAGVAKFDAIKVGDKITARYYDNIVLRLKLPGEQAVDTDAAALTPGTGAKPGATASTQRTITATITQIDLKVPSITFTGPNNWKYSSRVEDKAALQKVKVGDRVDITWTEAVMISLQ